MDDLLAAHAAVGGSVTPKWRRSRRSWRRITKVRSRRNVRAIPLAEPKTSDRPLQNHQLMAQSDVLEGNGGGAAEQGAEEGRDAEDEDHRNSQR